MYVNHRNGQTLKSATIPILGENRRIIGLLCMNFSCDVPLSKFISNLMLDPHSDATMKETESFSSEITDVISSSLEKIRQAVYSSPEISSVNRNKEIIRQLYEQGVFHIKDAVPKVADSLGISKNTVYLHLRNMKQGE